LSWQRDHTEPTAAPGYGGGVPPAAQDDRDTAPRRRGGLLVPWPRASAATVRSPGFWTCCCSLLGLVGCKLNCNPARSAWEASGIVARRLGRRRQRCRGFCSGHGSILMISAGGSCSPSMMCLSPTFLSAVTLKMLL